MLRCLNARFTSLFYCVFVTEMATIVGGLDFRRQKVFIWFLPMSRFLDEAAEDLERREAAETEAKGNISCICGYT